MPEPIIPKSDLSQLATLGWNSEIAAGYEPYQSEFQVGRVVVVHRNLCRILSIHGELDAVISRKLQTDLTDTTGKTQYHLSEISRFPVVGDWALFRYSQKDGKALVHGVLPRRTKISRNDPGRKTDEQVIAANIDMAFLIMALNYDYNLRRIERYLAILWNSDVDPVIVLNKADLVKNSAALLRKVRQVVSGTPVLLTSALKNTGLEELNKLLAPGKTCIFLGSSGVGKTTLINTIIGEERYAVQEISDYRDRGKHTTSAREMIFTESGGIIIDTPGLRRIDLWHDQAGFEDVFADIIELSGSCKFRNCTHTSEPECAVLAAVENGRLSPKRIANYRKLQMELATAGRKLKYRRDRRARISQQKQDRSHDRNEHHDRDQ
ncbi:MAG: ribosome small subunit-dependent GTPase A [FCB group bacterium]|nr:ribosome small subunit-dependent GTPase A [FCB group bacterium]